MAIFNSSTLGWQWTRMTLDEYVPYFDVLTDHFPLEETSEYPFPPGAIILMVESCYESIYGHDITEDEIMSPDFVWDQRWNIRANEGTADFIRFYAAYEDVYGNVGPLRAATNVVNLNHPGSLRGNVLLRPFDDEEIFSYNRFARAINIYCTRMTKPGIYPIIKLDFKLGWRPLGDPRNFHIDVQNLEDPTYQPFMLVDTPETSSTGLISLTGSLNSAKPAVYDIRNIVEPDPEYTNLKFGLTDSDAVKSFEPEYLRRMEEARGSCYKTAGYYPWRMYSWPTMDFNWYHGYSIEEIQSDYRWKTSAVHNSKAYIGGIARLKPVWSSSEVGGSITGTNRDRILNSPHRNFDRFFRKDYLDIINEDGDELMHIEKFADRLFVFKRNKTYVMNSGAQVNMVETEIAQGIPSSSAVCKTSKGLAFVTNTGVWFHNGNNLVNTSNRSFDIMQILREVLSDEIIDSIMHVVD